MAKHASEIIAFHLGYDMAEMSGYRYQSTRWTKPAVYTSNSGDYYAAPVSGKMPRAYCGFDTWECVAEHYGRKVFRAKQ
jgi:hypothetical protein